MAVAEHARGNIIIREGKKKRGREGREKGKGKPRRTPRISLSLKSRSCGCRRKKSAKTRKGNSTRGWPLTAPPEWAPGSRIFGKIPKWKDAVGGEDQHSVLKLFGGGSGKNREKIGAGKKREATGKPQARNRNGERWFKIRAKM